jgi:hypothetical protein
MCGAELQTVKTVKAVVAMPYHGFDAHSGAHMLRADPADMDPFIGIDSYTMPQPFFGPHPHAGMSAVTLMLPEAEVGLSTATVWATAALLAPVICTGHYATVACIGQHCGEGWRPFIFCHAFRNVYR